MKKILLIISILLFVALPALSQAQRIIDQVAGSHIEGNVPSKSDFDSFMRRDLASYFKSMTGKAVEIQYEFLRDGPTQTGVAYPKFYLWVKLFENNTIINQGAIRVAAIEKIRFEVTDFLGKDEITMNPEAIYSIFPRPVCDRIRDKMKQKL